MEAHVLGTERLEVVASSGLQVECFAEFAVLAVHLDAALSDCWTIGVDGNEMLIHQRDDVDAGASMNGLVH